MAPFAFAQIPEQVVLQPQDFDCQKRIVKERRRVISIVDDDESVREATSALVRSLGYAAATFASAEDFLESDRVNDTSCLITDVQMSGLSGVELQSRLIADGRLMPIIGVTAHPEESIRAQMLRAGAVGFLSKPFHDECLIDCLTTALKSSNSQPPAH
jgi:FixJ family two-component response regulator